MKPVAKQVHNAFLIFAVMISAMLVNMAFASTQSPDMIWQIESMQQDAKSLSKQAPVTERRNQTDTHPSLNLNANISLLKAQLNKAPALSMRAAGHQGVHLDLPTAEGQFMRFQAFESSLMQPALAKKFPTIKTYKIFGLEQPELSGVVDIGPRGFHAMVKGPQGSYYIDPDLLAFKKTQAIPESYFLFEGKKTNDFECHVGHKNSSQDDKLELDGSLQLQSKTVQYKQNGANLRNYRIAVSTTGEYTAAVSNANPVTQEAQAREQTQAAIVTAISRVNEIFQRDLAINLELVNNNDQLILINDQDNCVPDVQNDYCGPYADITTGEQYITAVINQINNIIGPENYDVGHLFTINGGGLAFLQAVCGDSKAGGVTGVGAGAIETDFFYVDFVAHELGHQFGGNHTFNANSGACNGNRNSGTAWEPGSGSTIMAYAGICAPQDLQSFSDDYFHGGSIEEILDFVDSQQGACFNAASTGDNPPSASAGINYNIPAHTPFFLSATANDIDGDILFYNWEQIDTGTSSDTLEKMNTDNGSRPLFRSYLPVTDARRFFPNFDDVLDNTSSIGETYPSTSRALDFRVTVRSNNYGSDYDDMRVNVIDTGKAFSINDPEAASFHIQASNMFVLWDKADTHKEPINCTHVNILFNENDSSTFDEYIPLVSNTENDGEHIVTLPNITSSQGRILIQCSDNIFYNVNPAPFNLVDANNTTISVNVDRPSITEGNEGFTVLTFTLNRDGNLNIASEIEYIIAGIGAHPANQNDFVSNQTMSGNVSFLEGESEKSILVSVQGDTVFEYDEMFQMRITDPGNTLIAKSRATVLIINNDIAVETVTESKISSKSSSKGHLGLYIFMLLFSLGIRAHRIKKTGALLIFLSLFTVLSACSPSQEKNQPALHPQAQVLEKFQYAKPSADLQKNLKLNDSRFIAFGPKGKLLIPGLVDDYYQQALKHGYRIQEGMGDVIFSQQHMKLREQFYIYASEYNQLLAEHLFAAD